MAPQIGTMHQLLIFVTARARFEKEIWENKRRIYSDSRNYTCIKACVKFYISGVSLKT